MAKAWELERDIRVKAVPLDRRINASNWFDPAILIQANDMLMKLFWEEHVPGSGAIELPYLEFIQAQENKGYDMSNAIPLFQEGMKYFREDNIADLRAVTTLLLEAVYNAPKIENHPYHKFSHPDTWTNVKKEMGQITEDNLSSTINDLDKRIYNGWLGQLAGSSFGTAIEGYTGEKIAGVYGEVTTYITKPETMNDDVVYELVLLDAFEKKGRQITSTELGLEWVRQIPFAWSAEWMALQNLKNGYLPPESGSFHNPYSNWIGAQMRGMICGMLAPGWPIEAARLAHLDGVVSHSANGVYGEIFAAVLTSLAFIESDPRKILFSASEYIPGRSEYKGKLDLVLNSVQTAEKPQDALDYFDDLFKQYNWIHAYPNMAADVFALYYGNKDMTSSFSLLAKAGMDVDCNGGLVGNVLGIMDGVPSKWADPIGDLLETYLPGKERLSIKELSKLTADFARL
jgi:ADP-ribosylglycohydrolase